jgi:hypothetical protein
MQRNRFDHLKLSLRIALPQTKSPLPVSRRGPYNNGDDGDVPLICPTRQAQKNLVGNTGIKGKALDVGARADALQIAGRPLMYFAAAVLAILSGLFYAASRHEIGSFGVAMCQYGSPFCDNPLLVLTAAGLAALWGGFVSVR